MVRGELPDPRYATPTSAARLRRWSRSGDPEPWRGENAPPEEEFEDEAGDKWKPNHWPRAELAGPEYKMFKKRQEEG
jgi:hypothetical protein